MPTPYASRDWDYKGKLIRTVVDDDGGVHIVLGDIRSILAPKDPYLTPYNLDGHGSRPLSGDRCQQTLIGESRIQALLGESPGAEAKPLGEWLESVVMPALREAGRHSKEPKTHDPILAGLKALSGLRAAQVARDRYSNALAEAVGLNENAALAISPPAGKTSMTDLIAWCQTQGVDLAISSRTTTTTHHKGGMSPLIDEALRTSSDRPSMRQPDVTDDTFVEDRDEDGSPALKARKMARRAPALDHEKVTEIDQIDPRALAEARKAALRAFVDEEDGDAVSPRSARRPARGSEKPTTFRQPPINGEDQLKALQAITLSKDKRKD